jgi:predicted RNA-binding protein YlqC (UPF0109 family)
MDASAEALEALFRQLVRPFLEAPEELRVQARVRDQGVLLVVKPGMDDGRRLIGRGGETLRALRALLDLAARRQGLRVQLDIQDV